MRSTYYIATVVNIYRKAIDEYFENDEEYKYNKNYEKILRNCANRDSVPQFFDGSFDEKCQYYNGRVEVSNQDFLGIVLDYDEKNKLMTVEQRNYFKKGDIVEIFGPKLDTFDFKLEKIYDENNDLIDIVRHPKQIVKIKIDKKVNKFDMIRIKR